MSGFIVCFFKKMLQKIYINNFKQIQRTSYGFVFELSFVMVVVGFEYMEVWDAICVFSDCDG